MRWLSRSYATACGGRRPRSKRPALGLEHFLQRQRVLALWRDIVRSINKIPASSTRREMRDFARSEFEWNRHVTDITHIRYLVSVSWELSRPSPAA
ncbi:hypothetical protein BDY21DRAFT_110224 [Lineolata rhizophorae]|uniref:LYR motif-containing protein 2 n=1 Tax=Lineolata rhizophorae TaxID=578093 RepID=A0A6A6NSH5_9PEZI|nr:hypothetical protein BDY21DRAFT_110224 [Lineolata rhizophorae]